MVEVARNDVQGLLDRAKGGDPVELLLESPSANAWVRLYQSWAWILLMRALRPCLALGAGAQAALNLRAHVAQLGGRAWPPTKPILVLVIEMVACPLLGVFFIGGSLGSSDAWSLAFGSFFGAGLSGWGMLTTLLMAV